MLHLLKIIINDSRGFVVVVKNLPSPITFINVSSYFEDDSAVIEKISKSFDELNPDYYLLRQQQIDFIKNELTDAELRSIDNDFWNQFYMGQLDSSKMDALISKLPPSRAELFHQIEPSRFRAVSKFNICLTDNQCNIKAIDDITFEQKKAEVSDQQLDYRMNTRVFDKLPNHYICDDFKTLIKKIACEIQRIHPKRILEMDVTVHHTKIQTNSNLGYASNSPEGIHQDGMDYIVSALVINRKNVMGGSSIIYGSDKKTKLFNVELQPGQGILQPDLNTDLWHTVTPIRSIDNTKGIRSTLGFDFEITKEMSHDA